MHLASIHTYPIKSCGSLTHGSIALDSSGPVWDRRWMVVDADGMFLTQRELPPMALIQPTLSRDDLTISAPGMPEINLPLHGEHGPWRQVEVWGDQCRAWDQGDEIAEWLVSYLDVEARLVRIADDFSRRVDERYAPYPAQTGFSDGFPLLIASEASLADLNARLVERGAAPVPMSRFRPNLVVTGCDAWVEDTWRTVQIGEVTLDVIKPCARCKITTVDQASGAIPDAKEPLATLATFRQQHGTKVMFAQNAIHRGRGTLNVGDSIEILA
jgi:uncharacterized protein YcbX